MNKIAKFIYDYSVILQIVFISITFILYQYNYNHKTALFLMIAFSIISSIRTSRYVRKHGGYTYKWLFLNIEENE